MSGHRRKLGDTNKPLEITLSPASVDVTGSTIRVLVRSTSALIVDRAPTVVAVTGPASLSCAILAGDFTVEGDYQCEVRVTFPDGKVQTFPENGYLSVRVVRNLG